MNKYFFLFLSLLPQFFHIDAQDYFSLGKACYKKSQFDSAIIYFNKAIEHNPDMIDAYIERAGTYDANGKLSRALEDYNKVIKMDSFCGKAYQGRANVYMKFGQRDKEIQDYKKAIALLPDDYHTYYSYINWGRQIIQDKGSIDSALYLISKAIDLTKKFTYNSSSLCYYERGRIFFQKGEFQKAIDDITASIDLGCHYAACYFIRGNSFKKLGKEDKAMLDMERYEQLKIDETNKKLKN